MILCKTSDGNKKYKNLFLIRHFYGIIVMIKLKSRGDL